ncbi:MAG: TIR domain-containing protein [Vicinamibacterales bacterium]
MHTQPGMHVTVFVSYQRADTAFAALALKYALRVGGHDAFVDTGGIGAGEQFRQAIAAAVAGSHVMLALVGPRFEAARLHEPASVVAFEWQRARFHGIPVVPVLVDGGTMPGDGALPAPLRWFTRHHALVLRRASSSADIEACVAAVPALSRAPRRAARVLWVDDNPANNEIERRALRPHGIVFDNVVSTDEALTQLEQETYDLVITDLSRADSSDGSHTAGASFLEQPILRDGGPPVIVYAGLWAVRTREALQRAGAIEVTADRRRLLAAVLEALGRVEQPIADLER